MYVLTLTNSADAPFLTQQVAALEKRGVTVETLAVDAHTDVGDLRRVGDYLRFFRDVRREADGGYDLIHAHYGLTAPMALAAGSTPVVLSLWGSDVFGPVAPLSRLCAPLCDEVVVMSEAMRRELGHDCEVIPDGVDLDRFVPWPRAAARERVGWRDDAYHVLFPYAPDREVKDYPRARRIVEVVDDRFDRSVLLRAVHGVDHAAVPAYVNAADALLLTSKSEGSPNAVKEALACNVPVVATDVGDVRERLDGVDPSVVATNDRELVDGLTEVLERGERSNGREAAREVSLDATTDAMLAVYRRAIDGGDAAEKRTSPVVRSG